MPLPANVVAAKERMERANAALLAYAERPSTEPTDPAKHKRLIAELRQASDEYVTLIAQLRP
jgi:hypothetical protein